jgi:hypothetical protein
MQVLLIRFRMISKGDYQHQLINNNNNSISTTLKISEPQAQIMVSGALKLV